MIGAERYGWDKAAIEMAADIANAKGVTVALEINGSITISPLSKRREAARESVRKQPKAEAAPAPANQPEKVNMTTLRHKDPEKWEKRLVEMPLGKREISILSELAANGLDEKMDEDLFTSFGHNASRRLWLRKMIDYKVPEDRLQPAKVWLTEEGKSAIIDEQQKLAKKVERAQRKNSRAKGWAFVEPQKDPEGW